MDIKIVKPKRVYKKKNKEVPVESEEQPFIADDETGSCCSDCKKIVTEYKEKKNKKQEVIPIIEREIPTESIRYSSIEEVIEFYNKSCKPIDNLKKNNGEVLTPLNLVNEMLNHLPGDVWSNPNLKWLDPAAGIGNFPFVVYMRLMIGLKDVIPDEEERRKHILEEMIYMCEYNDRNVDILKQIFS